jgi:hypothetical protein
MQIALQNWRNLQQEALPFAEFKPDKKLVRAFLKEYPTYARSYWQNVLEERFPRYLIDVNDGDGALPPDQLPTFLKLALFNYQQLKPGSSR